ncbi:leukocyte surface antigen CD53-like [Ostrea edulis]|uniref:leukocyte surface antigen CD53-like n=1 Tax=Ostrea edulis TaxID=37623 RepID=UPI0024AE8DA7|nr:leukocyte surface antigen CD53-like [Ostrea edulis]
MGLTGCGRIVKYSMFVLNLLTFMGGFGLLGYGSYLRSNNAPSIGILTIILEYVHLSFPWLLIITAVVCIGVSFLGCCGAIKKIRGMLTMHFLLLMALLIGIFVGGVLSYQYKQEIESTIILQMESSLNESYGTDNHITDAWDVLQSTLQCCGIEGNENSTLSWSFYKLSTSWFKNQRGARRLHYVPDSCCKYPADTNNLTKCIGLRDTHKAPVVGPPILPIMTNDQFYSQGCWTVLYSILNNKLWVAMVLITTVAALLLIGMIMSICLCKRIEDEMYEEDEERFQDFIVS